MLKDAWKGEVGEPVDYFLSTFTEMIRERLGFLINRMVTKSPTIRRQSIFIAGRRQSIAPRAKMSRTRLKL